MKRIEWGNSAGQDNGGINKLRKGEVWCKELELLLFGFVKFDQEYMNEPEALDINMKTGSYISIFKGL